MDTPRHNNITNCTIVVDRPQYIFLKNSASPPGHSPPAQLGRTPVRARLLPIRLIGPEEEAVLAFSFQEIGYNEATAITKFGMFQFSSLSTLSL